MFKIKETVHISLINVYCDLFIFHLKRENKEVEEEEEEEKKQEEEQKERSPL